MHQSPPLVPSFRGCLPAQSQRPHSTVVPPLATHGLQNKSMFRRWLPSLVLPLSFDCRHVVNHREVYGGRTNVAADETGSGSAVRKRVLRAEFRGQEVTVQRLVTSVIGVAVIGFISGCSSGAPPVASSTATTSSDSAPRPPTNSGDDRASWVCPDPVDVVLPTWARAGWSPPTQSVSHLMGTDQAIVAVPFGWPLRDPANQPRDHVNKILWIAKTQAGPLYIVATEQATGETVTKELPDGPGPSIVNMPRAGCWRFALQWGDHCDEIFIRYYGESTPP